MVPGIVPDTLLFLLLLWLFDGIALLPVLLSGAVRRLVRTAPTDSLAANYLAWSGAYALTHLLLILVPVALRGGSLERNVMGWLIGITLLHLLLWWIVVAVVLPVQGVWTPKEAEEYDGRIALTLGLFSYVIATGVMAFVLVVVIIAVGFPG